MNPSFQFIGKSNLQNTPDDIVKIFKTAPDYFKTQKGTSNVYDYFHMHNYMQLWYVLRDSFQHSVGERCFHQGEGAFLLVPAYTKHRIDTSRSKNVEFIFCDLSDGVFNIFPDSAEKNVLFNLTYLRPLLTNAELTSPFLIFSDNTAEQIRELFFQLLNEYKNLNCFSQTFLRSNIIRLLTLIAHKYQSLTPRKEDALYFNYRAAIQDALNYIDTHYLENIRLKDVCKIALMSTHSFSHIFRSVTGKTFIQYIQYLRIRSARKLLTETNKSLVIISMECGFNDVAYFCRVFKKNTGYTPTDFRNISKKAGAFNELLL